MDGNSGGTPNPLNPAPGNVGSGSTAQPASFAQATEPSGTSAQSIQPTQSTQPMQSTQPTQSAMPEMQKAAPTSAMPNIPQATPRPAAAGHGVVDPMMRPTTRYNNANNAAGNMGATNNMSAANAMGGMGATSDYNATDGAENFDTLGMDNVSLDDLRQAAAGSASDAAFTTKDSIVEPAGGKKSKKPLIIGAIVLVIIAVICGVAAVVVAMMGNNGDRVGKAIDKLLNGEVFSIISAQGTISASNQSGTSNTTSTAISTSVNFNGTFDTATGMNKVNASVAMDYGTGSEVSISVDEVTNKSGDTFFKISGLSSIAKALGGSATLYETNSDGATDIDEVEIIDVTDGDEEAVLELYDNCSPNSTNCISSGSSSTSTDGSASVAGSLLTLYSGVFEVVDDQWILVSDGFGDAAESLEMFDNGTACLINAFGTLSTYGKDLANKYKANPFITYSTDNLEIAKKKNELYRLGIDSDKLSAFSNSLGNNGFINELNACAGNTATNSGAAANMVKEIFSNFPTMYAEVDDNNNFTRFYFKASDKDGDKTSTVTADLSLSYPTELKITEPEEYIEMSTLLTNIMSGLFTGDTTVIEGETAE